MKRILIVVLLLALVGCAGMQTERKFPPVPDEINQACPDLTLIDPKTDKLSVVVDVVTDNYTQYQYCQVKVGGWIKWYNDQKAIFESVK
jgi:hypothetical protein